MFGVHGAQIRTCQFRVNRIMEVLLFRVQALKGPSGLGDGLALSWLFLTGDAPEPCHVYILYTCNTRMFS